MVEEKRDLFRPKGSLQEALGRIVVLADAAHSFGAVQNGKASGSIADFSCFSFHAVKNLTSAEGGAATWKDIPGIGNDDIYRKYMLLSLHGQSKDALSKTKLGSWEYDIEGLYFKCNMTDLQAGLGLAQLERFPQMLKKRMQLITLYDSLLQSAPVTPLSHHGDFFCGNGHLYPIRILGKDEAFRNRLIEAMARDEVATNVHYKPLPMFSAYKALGFDINDYPNAFAQYQNEVTLPLYSTLTEEQASFVAEVLLKNLNTMK